MSANLGTTTYTSVTWTAGDVITEAKLDNMVANDQAYDSHASQGLLLNNNKSFASKNNAGDTNVNIALLNASDEVLLGDAGYTIRFQGNFNAWIPSGETWTYASADDPTFTFTISGDKTTKYCAGMKIMLTQTTTKYFIITKVSYSAPNTTVTVYGGTDYDLANASITDPYYSMVRIPHGFPMDPSKWMVRIADTESKSKTNPTGGTFYGGANAWTSGSNISITVPIGVWNLSFSVCVGTSGAGESSHPYPALSTSNNSISDMDLTSYNSVGYSTNAMYQANDVRREKTITLGTKTVYYLLLTDKYSNKGGIQIQGGLSTTIIEAVCAYL